MSATHQRDQIYSRLHSELFRSRDFRKHQRWISKAVEKIHLAVERPQHRYESPECATLGLNIYVFHEDYHSLMIGFPSFPGVDRVSIPVFSRGLRWLVRPIELQETILPSTDIEEVFEQHCAAVQLTVFPIFDRCMTLSGILEVVRELTPPSRLKVQTEAGLLLLLGKQRESQKLLLTAIESANEHERKALIEAHAKLFKMSDRGHI